MLRWIVDRRLMTSAATAAVACAAGRSQWPGVSSDPVLRLIAFQQPWLHDGLHAAYALLLFTTPYLGCSVLLSLADIFIVRQRAAGKVAPLPAYPPPRARNALFLVVGERHHATKQEASPSPSWLTIPDRGLFTGMAIIGAVGSGKTSGCMYPFADQLFGYRATDPDRRIGGLVLEVKGDFCHQVRRILAGHGREADYVEVGLEGPWRYNPLHNDLDAYALAYRALTARGKTPQHAATAVGRELLGFIWAIGVHVEAREGHGTPVAA